jgi:RimJ/RimL family protein N-acetyltransferase
MFADSAARRFYPAMVDLPSAESWIGWNVRSYEANGFGLWVIEELSTGEFLGDCGLTYQAVEGQRSVELGYHLALRSRGHGFATEAGAACLDHGFDQLSLTSICSLVDPANSASIAVATRLHRHRREYERENGRKGLLFWTERPDREADEILPE